MELLVSYDVVTDTPDGQRRLRRVAKLCESYGQRVQKSVFECILTETQLVRLLTSARRVIDPDRDSFRVYRLAEPYDQHVHILGRGLAYGQREPLIV